MAVFHLFTNRQSQIINHKSQIINHKSKITTPVSPTQFLASLRSDKHYANQIVHLEHIAPRAAKYARLDQALHPALQDALKQSGIEKFSRIKRTR